MCQFRCTSARGTLADGSAGGAHHSHLPFSLPLPLSSLSLSPPWCARADLSEPIDVYTDWIDACEEENNEPEPEPEVDDRGDYGLGNEDHIGDTQDY